MADGVSRETNILDEYARLLLKWNKRISLVSRKSTKQTLNRLLQHVKTAAILLPEHLNRIYDFGSGNGMPGMAFAAEHPDMQVVLVERSEKKSLFLEFAADHLGLTNVSVESADYRQLDIAAGGPTAITSLALDLYGDISARLWPVLKAGDGAFLFIDQQLAEKLHSHVSCGTYWWKPLPDTNMSGICWLEKPE